MIKSICKDEIKDIPYGKIKYSISSIIPCNMDNDIYDGTTVSLAVYTDKGLKIVRNNIGKVIEVDENTVKIQFDTTFGFDDKLYALITGQTITKAPLSVVVAYKEA